MMTVPTVLAGQKGKHWLMCGTVGSNSCFDLNYKFPEAVFQRPNIYPILLEDSGHLPAARIPDM